MKERPRLIVPNYKSTFSFHLLTTLSKKCLNKSFILVYSLEHPFSLHIVCAISRLRFGE